MSASNDTISAFRETFRLDELTIIADQRWNLSVRPGQLTLGAMVLSSERGHLDFQGFDSDDAVGMTRMIGVAERLAKQHLGAVRINLACLMMKDPIVHYHVLPRYDGPVERYGQTWTDEDWPGPPTFGKTSTSDNILHAIRDDLAGAV